ncbi:MAG: DNA replication/repair protein RecF [Eubacterium sp.]|nr:DNA replication/repair protein RecF [Eubacterium sp.]
MILKSLELSNFRNYKKESFEFDPGTNVLYGDNAQGKTNVLEAVFVGGTTKSHKGSRDSEMINREEKEGHLRYKIEKNGRETVVEIHLRKQGNKGIAIDRVPVRNSEELLGLCHLVFFSPEDLGIIRDGPEIRRRFIDMELCQLNRIYLQYLVQYRKNLKQRNALLKQIHEKPELRETLELWNQGLIENGKKIIGFRRDFVGEIDTIMREKHRKLTGGTEEIHIQYEPNISADRFEEALFLAEDRDCFQGTTTIGPHRDDIRFLNGEEDVRKYGSQGQKRTAALSLKMSEIELVERKIGDKPILLLDDVLSELDRNRQSYLLEQIHGVQTIITCTGLEEFIHSGIGIDKTFHIVNGVCQEVQQNSGSF